MEFSVDLRTVLVLVTTSAALTVLSPALYRRDPTRRKCLLAVLTMLLAVLPWWSALGFWTLPVGVDTLSLQTFVQPVPGLLMGLWCLGGGMLIARDLLGVVRGRRRLLALPRMHGPVEVEIARLAGSLGIKLPVIRVGGQPCASSLGTPTLVLPRSIERWPSEPRRAVIAHELAHLQRFDDRLMLFVRALADWYWWMPWLRWFRRRYVEAMEESCDERARRTLDAERDYVTGLVQAARLLTADAGAEPVATAEAEHGRYAWVQVLGRSHFAARVARLVDHENHEPRITHSDGSWTVFWICLMLAVAITAEPRLIPADTQAYTQANVAQSVSPTDFRRLVELDAGVGVRHTSAAKLIDDVHTVATENLEARAPRVQISNWIQDSRTKSWRFASTSSLDPLPVYPSAAFERGLQGTVDVEYRILVSPYGGVRAIPLEIFSSDSTGLLVTAVERALANAPPSDVSAMFRAVATHNNRYLPPPGKHVRLRKQYTFALRAIENIGVLHDINGG